VRRGNQTRPNIRWRCTLALYLVKTTERSVHGGDAALCQTTLTTCLISTSDIYTLNKKKQLHDYAATSKIYFSFTRGQ